MTNLKITKSPCAKCPFRDGDWLRPRRREEIARGLADGDWFACHATVDYEYVDQTDEEWWEEPDGAITGKSLECAGAVILSDRSGFVSNYRRVIDGFSGEAELNESAIPWESLNDWVTQGVEDTEPCSVVGPHCEAPAGYMNGGVVVHGTASAEHECKGCGEPVCEACLTDGGYCDYCEDRE